MADEGAENVRFNRLSSDATGQKILSSGCKAMADQGPSASSRRAHKHENKGIKGIIGFSNPSSHHPLRTDYTDLTQLSKIGGVYIVVYLVCNIRSDWQSVSQRQVMSN